ncbi:hypothetical protein EYC84_008613 [Monilinia fructicola]|uniref:Uncharacterized protein n=1 Tax=Monilinia fructicola TaxID=38448 RepID=A0A5M9JJU4_MONFR|nr:hypothetical protein EYC84_008613 [Monilinia fructicola]
MVPFPSPTSTWHSKTYPSLSPTRPELSAKGKSVLITGGGSGIGAETALYFATAGASRIALLGQVAFAKFAGNGKGKIDVLVSNAASLGPMSLILDLNGDEFLEYIHQSLKGTLSVAQTFLKYASTGAVVINTSSLAAHINAMSGLAPYSIAKLGIVRFWDYLIYENPEISVFHVQPGVVDTAMGQQAGGVEALGQEDDVSLPASFNVWLASPEARFLKESAQLSIGLVGWPFENVN